MITAIGLMIGLYCIDHFWNGFRKEESLSAAIWKFICFCITVLCLIYLLCKDFSIGR